MVLMMTMMTVGNDIDDVACRVDDDDDDDDERGGGGV
jgi:hypothetical protein